MKIISIVLGNFHQDREWTQRLSGAVIDWVMLDHALLAKNRIDARTSKGEVVLLAPRDNNHFKDGDILEWVAEEERAIVVRIISRKNYVSKYDNPQKFIECSTENIF